VPGTTLYVSAEQGSDSCFDGKNPVPSSDPNEPCPYPGAPWPGPFKTITRALSVLGTPGYTGLPFQIYIAGRRNDLTGAPIPYDAANGEIFPLSVTNPQVTLRYDAAHSDRAPGGGITTAIISGPDVSLQTETINFVGIPQNLGTCGIDGSGGPSLYGFEIRGGLVSLILHADTPTGGMNATVRGVLFSGGAPGNPSQLSGNGVNLHAINAAQLTVLIEACRFTTSFNLNVAPSFPGGSPFVGVNAARQAAFIQAYANQLGGIPPGPPTLTATIHGVSMEPEPGVNPVPEITYGIEVDPWSQSLVDLTLTEVEMEGASAGNPAAPEGIGTGIRVNQDTRDFLFTVNGASSVNNCGVYGIHIRPAFVAAPVGGITPHVTIESSSFIGNGVRAGAPSGCAPGTGGQCLPGAAIGIEIQTQGYDSYVTGSIASNNIAGNRVGIVLDWNQNTRPGGVGPYPGALSIYGNFIFSQVLNPPLIDPVTAVTYSGVGLLMIADNLAFIDDPVLVDSNRIYENDGHGVLLLTRPPAASPAVLSPRFQNNLIYSNGQDGVEVRSAGAGTMQPRFVYHTIWDNALFGVDNVFPAATSRPEIYRSILWGNNGTPGASNDLNGFSLAPAPAFGLVQSSDFCGSPWVGTTCGGVPAPPVQANNWNVSVNPFLFVPPTGQLQLLCNLVVCPPPCPTCISPCVDILDPAIGIPAPPFAVPFDAAGVLRPVAIKGTTPIPDMGALEKPSCCF
jgi:hypothetical protein